MARRPFRMGREGVDRRALRRVAGVLCLVLALYCLIAAAATLGAQTAPDDPEARKLTAPRSLFPLLAPISLAFVVVLAAVIRRRRASRAGRPADGGVSAAA